MGLSAIWCLVEVA